MINYALGKRPINPPMPKSLPEDLQRQKAKMCYRLRQLS